PRPRAVVVASIPRDGACEEGLTTASRLPPSFVAESLLSGPCMGENGDRHSTRSSTGRAPKHPSQWFSSSARSGGGLTSHPFSHGSPYMDVRPARIARESTEKVGRASVKRRSEA